MKPKKIHVCFITTGLLTGGAEVMLYKLLKSFNKECFNVSVISLRDRGTLGEKIKNLGFSVYTINSNRNPFALYSLVKLIKRLRPDILQGWMYHGNAAAQMSKVFLPKNIPVIWSIHNSLESLKSERGLTKSVIKFNAYLSKYATEILYVGKKIKTEHQLFGFEKTKGIVIPNGFETDLFMPSLEAKWSVRQELGLPKDAPLIGLIGRYHQVKDHPNFLKAAELINKKHPRVYFLLAGRGVDENNGELVKMVDELGIKENVRLLGERQDIPRLLASLDIACSSSYSEAFPLVLGEAMSCEVPCVATDVGDSAWLLGETGLIVPPRNPQLIAESIITLIEEGSERRKGLGEKARQRIIDHFSIESVASRYQKLYQSFYE